VDIQGYECVTINFFIDPKAKEAWLNAMARALDSVEISREHRAELWNYLELAANSLVNQE